MIVKLDHSAWLHLWCNFTCNWTSHSWIFVPVVQYVTLQCSLCAAGSSVGLTCHENVDNCSPGGSERHDTQWNALWLPQGFFHLYFVGKTRKKFKLGGGEISRTRNKSWTITLLSEVFFPFSFEKDTFWKKGLAFEAAGAIWWPYGWTNFVFGTFCQWKKNCSTRIRNSSQWLIWSQTDSSTLGRQLS